MNINTIIAIISAIALIYTTVSFTNKRNITATDIIALLMSLMLFIVMVKSDKIFTNDLKSSYSSGFNTAIQAAELVEVNEDCYHIAFGDEVHCYER